MRNEGASTSSGVRNKKTEMVKLEITASQYYRNPRTTLRLKQKSTETFVSSNKIIKTEGEDWEVN